MTKEEFIALVKSDYKLVKPENYSSLKKCAHLRYVTKRGEYRRGGYLNNIQYIDVKDKKTGKIKRKMYLWIYTSINEVQTGKKNSKSKKWKVDTDSITALYKRLDFEGSNEIQQLDKTQKKVNQEVEDMKNDLYRIEKLPMYMKILAEDNEQLKKDNEMLKKKVENLEFNMTVLIEKLHKRFNKS